MPRFLVIAGGRAAQAGARADGPAEAAGPHPSAAPPGSGLLAELYARHAGAVFGRCRWLLRDEEAARDATQEVFARALRALPELRAATSTSAWLLRVATNHCLNEVRSSRAPWREELTRMAAERGEGGVGTAAVPERRELLRALLGRASPEEQEAAVMYFVDELTQAEIAEVTGRSLPTVRKRLRGFLAAARAALAEALPGIALPEEDAL